MDISMDIHIHGNPGYSQWSPEPPELPKDVHMKRKYSLKIFLYSGHRQPLIVLHRLCSV